MASRRQLSTCDGPEHPPHFPAATGLPPGHPAQGSPCFRERATCKQVQEDVFPKFGWGTAIYQLWCDQNWGKIQVDKCVPKDTGFLFCLCYCCC